MLLPSLKVQFYILEGENRRSSRKSKSNYGDKLSAEFVVIVFVYCEISSHKVRVSKKIEDWKKSFIYEVKMVMAT